MEDGWGAALAGIRVPLSVCFGPLPGTTAGREAVWRLRGWDVVAIPDGVERIGDCWFYGC